MIRQVLILILSFIAFHTSQGNDVNLQSLPDEAARIFEQFQKKIQTSINSTVEILNDYKNIKESSGSYVSKGRTRINDTYMVLAGQLNDFKQLAQEDSTDIYDCTYRKERAFSKIFTDRLTDLSICVDQKITNALNLIDNAIQFISDRLKVVKNLGQQLHDCGVNSLCLSTIISKIIIEDGVLTKQITNKLIDTSHNIIGIRVELENCVYVNLKSMIFDGGNKSVEINDCIYKRINNNTII